MAANTVFLVACASARGPTPLEIQRWEDDGGAPAPGPELRLRRSRVTAPRRGMSDAVVFRREPLDEIVVD